MMFLRLAMLLGLILVGSSGLQAAPRSDFQRGMVVSCPRWGPIWGSPAMAESLAELKQIGVDSVAIHPYGWVKRNGIVKFQPAAELEFLGAAVELARKAGVDLFWKPHLGYWGEFAWRGEIEFGQDEAAWRRFFADYEAFIVDQARFAASAGLDLFAVGVELEATTHREEDWRRIIASVREVFPGTVVYAANWDRLKRVPFWDAVDWIGVHAYFPLSEAEDPDRALLRSGWEPPLAGLRRLSRAVGKPVLIAEIGYNLNPAAAREPWRYESEDSPESRALRTRLIDVAIERIASEDFVRGMYWWKWMPGRTHFRRNFSMRDSDVKRVLARRWVEPAEAALTAR
ncbi:MAG: hypothetical protein GY769_15730 [bacterium]|nr:hypothetical protein [bacterium]